MILGLLSDTHGHIDRTHAALDLLLAHHPSRILHCGDIGSEGVLYAIAERLAAHDIPVRAVFGNVDAWDPSLRMFPDNLGISIRQVQRGEADGLRYAVCHGHDERAYLALLEDPELDLLFTGHTHVARDEREGRVRVINPGAVYRATVPSVAFFDSETKRCRFLPLS